MVADYEKALSKQLPLLSHHYESCWYFCQSSCLLCCSLYLSNMDGRQILMTTPAGSLFPAERNIVYVCRSDPVSSAFLVFVIFTYIANTQTRKHTSTQRKYASTQTRPNSTCNHASATTQATHRHVLTHIPHTTRLHYPHISHPHFAHF